MGLLFFVTVSSRVFTQKLTEWGKATLHLGIICKCVGSQSGIWVERRNQLSASLPLSLVPDCGEVHVPVIPAGATTFPKVFFLDFFFKESCSCCPRTHYILQDGLKLLAILLPLLPGRWNYRFEPPSPVQHGLTKKNTCVVGWQQQVALPRKCVVAIPQLNFMFSSIFHHRQ